jgi:hypothetical protein
MPPTRAVAYFRLSTDRQEASIPQQREEVQRYAARHQYTILSPFGNRLFPAQTGSWSSSTSCGESRSGKVDLISQRQSAWAAFQGLSPMASLPSLPDRVQASAVGASGSEHCDGMLK